MGIFSEAVDVVLSVQGEPLQLTWRGVLYDVGPAPLCWYERRPWWQSNERLPPGAGVGVVDTQIWRLVLTSGDGAPFTLDVAHYRPAGRWRVIKIYDAVDVADAADDVGAGDDMGAADVDVGDAVDVADADAVDVAGDHGDHGDPADESGQGLDSA